MAIADNRYYRLFESARDGILLVDFGTLRVLDANPQAAAMLGWERSEIGGEALSALALFHDSAALSAVLTDLRAVGHSRTEVTGVLTLQGRHIDVEQTSSLYDDGGRQTAQFILRDITRRKRAEKRLRESEARYRATYDFAAVGIAHVDLTGRWLSMNDKLCSITGYDRDTLLGMSFQDITHPDDLEEDEESMKRSLDGEFDSYSMEKRYIRQDGATIWVCLTSSIVRDEDGRAVNFIAVVEDISARKQAEAALQEREARFKIMADAAPVLIWLAGTDARCHYFNQAWLQFTGRTLEQEVGNGWAEGVHADDLDHCLHVYTTAFHAREPFEMEYRLRHHTGTHRWILDRGVPLFAEDGSFDGYIGGCVDVHVQKTASEELLLARNHAEAANRAKDQFLAALSHELRTPLSPVLLISASLEQDATLSDAVRADFAAIRKNIELEASLIDDLLDVSRITQGKLLLKLETIDPHRLIDHVLDLLHGDIITKNLRVTLDPAASPASVHADPVRLEQVIWNVLRNAVKFTPQGGRIHIQTGKTAESFHLQVSDTGMGITRSEMPRIFTAFSQGEQAAEPRFGGVGLGLSICSHLIQEHQGKIWAESAGRGHGATFHVELPLVENAVPSERAHPPEAEVPHECLRILLVEDNEATRSALSRFLTRHGHLITAAGSLGEARQHARHGTFDVLVSDIGLPDGSGHELMRELKNHYGMSGIALSGYGMASDVEESMAAGFTHHLCKPVRIRQVEQAIASTIRRRREAGMVGEAISNARKGIATLPLG